jgi:hypothetical protein
VCLEEKQRGNEVRRKERRKSLRRGEGAGYFDEPMVVGSIPTGGASRRSSVVEQRKENARAADSRRKKMPGWRGGELLRLQTMRGCCSAALLDNSSRLEFAGANR